MPILLVILLSSSTPQTPDLTGKWAVEVEAASMRTDDGGSRSRSALKLEMDIRTKGTDVSARFTSVRGDTIQLTGTWKDGRLDLASEWREIDITNNGKPAKARARWVIKGGLKNAVLGGTWDFQMGDSSLPQRWTAKRRTEAPLVSSGPG